MKKTKTEPKDIRHVQVNGNITVPVEVSDDVLTDEFIKWMDSKGYTFNGYVGLFTIVHDND